MNTTETWPESLPVVWQLYHDNGYTVIVRDSRVYLFHAGAPRHCLTTEVDRGRWISCPAVKAFVNSHLYEDMAGAIEDQVLPPWRHCSTDLDVQTVLEFRQVARDCYCYQGVLRCDFCTGMRRPDRFRNDYATVQEAQEFLTAEGFKQEAPCQWTKGKRWASIHGDGSNAGLPTVYGVQYGEDQ